MVTWNSKFVTFLSNGNTVKISGIRQFKSFNSLLKKIGLNLFKNDEEETKRLNYLDTLNYLTKIKLNKIVEIRKDSVDADIYSSLVTAKNLLTLTSKVKEVLGVSVMPFNKNKIFQIDANLNNNVPSISIIGEKDEIFEKLNLTKEIDSDTSILESDLLRINLEMILFVEGIVS